ncbi:MAG: hypothetical protein ACE5JM_01635 [Armatimonadota bacterium]
MKAGTARAFAAWTAVIVASAALLQGCGVRQFHVRKQQVVATVNAQGQPGQSTQQFTTADTAAYCWFEYLNAPANKTLRCEISYTDPEGNTEARDTSLVIKPGNHKMHFGVEVPRGEGLKVGNYDAQVYDGELGLFGTPLHFVVAEAPGAPSVAPVMEVAPIGPGVEPLDLLTPPAAEEEPPAETESGTETEIETSQANMNPFR